MPTYEYECEKCGLVFEEFQSMIAEPLSVCRTADCKGTVHRLVSGGAGFLFKGSGFYITDYRSDSYKKAAKADTSGSGSSSTPSSGTGASTSSTSSSSSTSSTSSSSSSSSTSSSGSTGS